MSLKSIVLAALRPSPGVMAYKRADGSTWLTVRNAADTEAAEMVIDGSIGESWYDSSGTTSKGFRKALNEIPKTKQVMLRINSPGGSVGDALSIYNMVKERGNIDTCVDGYALSSASIILQAGRKRIMPKSSIVMIHEPWSMTVGNEEEHKKAAEMLATHAETLAGIYADASGKSKSECRTMMQAETWMNGEEAEKEGFTDEIEEDEDVDTEARAKVATLDFSQFANVPQAVLAMAKPISAATSSGGLLAPPPVNAPQDPNMNTPTTPTAAVTPPATPPAYPAAPVAAAPTEPGISRAEYDALKGRLDTERKSRIEAKLDTFITEQRLTNDERADALTRALADETYLEVIAKRPSLFDAGQPVQPHGGEVTVIGNFMDKIRAIKAQGVPHGMDHNIGGAVAVSAAMRYEERKKNWAEMLQQAMAMDQRAERNRGSYPGANHTSNPNVNYCKVQPTVDGGYLLPVAASTYSSSLIVDQLADGAISQLVNTLAPLRVFTLDFAPSPMMPLNTIQVRLVTQGSGTLLKTPKSTGTGITATQVNYEQGDHTVTNVPITMYEYNRSFYMTPQELMSGQRIEFLAKNVLETLGSDILSDTLTLLNDQTFSAGPSGGSITAHYGTWTWNALSSTVNDMAVLRSQLGKSGIKNAILDPVLFSKLITVPVANQMQVGMPLASANSMRNIMGWNEIAETTAWGTGQGAGGSTASYPQPIIGFACNPQAIAVGARLPLLPPEGIPGNTIQMATVQVPGLDLTIAIFSWFSLQYRTLWSSYGLCFGCHQGDLTAGCVVKSLGI